MGRAEGIIQNDFNGNPNGYTAWDLGGYSSYVNWQGIGIYCRSWHGVLTYYIR